MDVDGDVAGVPNDLFQPHVISSPQQLKPPKKLAPEYRLMMAVLDDAVRCVEEYRHPTDALGRRLFYEAKQWLLAADRYWPYSFERICAVLDLDANAVRHRLRLEPERPPVSVSRETQMTTHERGTAVSVTSDTSVGSAPRYPTAFPSRSHKPTRSAVGMPRVAAQTQ